MKRIRLKTVLLIAILYLAHQTSIRAQNKSILTLANNYSVALRKYQKQRTRTSIEGVFRKGKAVSDKFDELESLTEDQYSLLRRRMKGFILNRQEVLIIDPDPKFFEKQARINGLKSDVAFFKLMRRVRPGGVFAAYIEMQTDVTGCTIYGNGLLTRLYGDLLRYRKAHSGKYVADIKNEIDDLITEFSVGGCSCGDLSGVLKEFRLFIKTYPKDPKTKEIRRNLTQIRTHGDFRPNCQSG